MKRAWFLAMAAAGCGLLLVPDSASAQRWGVGVGRGGVGVIVGGPRGGIGINVGSGYYGNRYYGGYPGYYGGYPGYYGGYPGYYGGYPGYYGGYGSRFYLGYGLGYYDRSPGYFGLGYGSYRPYSNYYAGSRYYDGGYYDPYYYREVYPQYSVIPAGYASPAPATASSARIDVVLPDGEGEVWFDGHKTRQGGTSRTFHTPALEPGSYTYQISAAWHQGGRLVSEERTVTVRPGTSARVDFTQPPTLPPPKSDKD